jgi:hypothetical protein
MAKKPYENSRLALFIAQRIIALKARKSQADIAAEAGFANANNVTMVKQGASKLAIDRVPAMARALECDPALLLRLALEQDVGNTAAAAIFAVLEPLTENERAWIAEIRAASGDTDPPLARRAKAAIRAIFGK